MSATKLKLYSKLSKLLDFRNLNEGIEIKTFKGQRDAGTYRWFSTNVHPQIISHLTMTEVLKAKELFYYFDEHHNIEISDEDMSKSTFFHHIIVNPEIELRNI